MIPGRPARRGPVNRIPIYVLLVLPLIGCDTESREPSSAPKTNQQVAADLSQAVNETIQDEVKRAPPRPADFAKIMQGAKTYAMYCARCHGPRAEGALNWQQRDASGNFPPPPLNGTAHTWHHPRRQLVNIIQKGGRVMPPFGSMLDDSQISDIIDWLLSLWPDEVYVLWAQRNEAYEQRLQ